MKTPVTLGALLVFYFFALLTQLSFEIYHHYHDGVLTNAQLTQQCGALSQRVDALEQRNQ